MASCRCSSGAGCASRIAEQRLDRSNSIGAICETLHAMPMSDSGWSLPSTPQTVAFGVPIADALPEAAERLSARRLAVVTTNSLAGSGGLAEVVRNILGPKFHSVVAGIRSHTPRADVVRVIKTLEGADGVVTLGGGSVCDSAKAARLCLANGITDASGMDRLRSYDKAKGSEPGNTISPSLPFIAVA